jgi:hypothetical protein
MSGQSGKRTSSGLSLEILEIEPMASGHRSLRLTRSVSWAAFDVYAEGLVRVLSGRVEHRADSPAERVWSVDQRMQVLAELRRFRSWSLS